MLKQTEEAVREANESLSGHIRLTAPAGYGVRFLQQPLLDFLERHPKITASVDLSNQLVDLIADRIDLAIRIGPVDNHDLVARRLCVSERWVVAAPSLIERVGRPEHPRELTSLPCLLYAYQAKPNVWIFDDDGERLEVQIDGPLRVNNDDFAVEAAVRGFGFT